MWGCDHVSPAPSRVSFQGLHRIPSPLVLPGNRVLFEGEEKRRRMKKRAHYFFKCQSLDDTWLNKLIHFSPCNSKSNSGIAMIVIVSIFTKSYLTEKALTIYSCSSLCFLASLGISSGPRDSC